MKKQMKRMLFTLICVITTLSANAQTVVIDGLKYSLSGAYASVRGIASGNTDETITIPSAIMYDGVLYTVNEIGEYAFGFNSSTAKNIVLPNTIERIMPYAFSNNRYGYGTYEKNPVQNVNLPEGLKSIGERAFENSCITSLIIPSTMEEFAYGKYGDSAFNSCSMLRTLVYLSSDPPKRWTSTSQTYVPSKDSYNNPKYSINDASVIEMITFAETTFAYTGKVPIPTWTNNVDGYTASLAIPQLESNAGQYDVMIPATFTNGIETFSTVIPYRYTITPATLIAKVNNASREYGDSNPSFVISYTGFVNGDKESSLTTKPVVSTTAIQTSNVGNYPITISGGNSNNYTFVYEPGTLTITKAPLTAKVNDVSRQYGKDNPSYVINYTGLKNEETAPKWAEALKIETTATKQSDIGTYIITATGVPVNYNLPKIENGTLTITQAPLTVKANNATRRYFDEEPNFEYTCSGFLNDDDKKVLINAPTITTEATRTSNVGKYKITPSGAKAKNYDISYEQGELTITRRQLNVTSHSSRQYGEENPVLPMEYDGFVNDETETVLSVKPVGATKATKTSSVGDYSITISGGEATNYSFVYEQGVLTVTKASLSAKVNDATKVYGANNPNFSIEYNGLKNGETVPAWATTPTFQTEATKSSGVGKYVVKAINGVPVNYEMAIADGTLSITPAPLTIIASDATRMYYDEEPDFDFTCSGFLNNDDKKVLMNAPKITTEATRTSSVGKYKITPSGAKANNYDISYEQGELTITKRPLTVTSHCSRPYGEENPSFPMEYNGFVNNESVNVLTKMPEGKTKATKTSFVGDYPITISGGEATNYSFVYEQGVLTVTKASLSAKVNNATKVYGANNPNFSIEYYGLKNGETVPEWTAKPTFQTEATKSSGVGEYDVKAVNGVAVNYELTISDGTLRITPAPLIIKANDATRLYNSEDPSFSYRCSGFVNGDDTNVLISEPKLSTSATLSSQVGTYDIYVSETSSPNYSITYVNGTLTITPRTLVASVGNYERKYNEENPAFIVRYEGFVGNEDDKVLKENAKASTTATKTSNVGTYPIQVTGGRADNYKFSYSAGMLTVNKAEQTISWNQDLSIIGVGDQVELTAKSSSGLPVTYSVDNNSIAEVYSAGNKSYLDCKEKGEFQIVAVQDGNQNYYPSPRIRKNLVIGDVSAINEVAESPVKIQGTPYGARVINAKIGDVIFVYSIDGTLQKKVKVVGTTTDIPLADNKLYIVKVKDIIVKLRL